MGTRSAERPACFLLGGRVQNGRGYPFRKWQQNESMRGTVCGQQRNGLAFCFSQVLTATSMNSMSHESYAAGR